jgi:hypothetical protein
MAPAVDGDILVCPRIIVPRRATFQARSRLAVAVVFERVGEGGKQEAARDELGVDGEIEGNANEQLRAVVNVIEV